MYERTRMDEWMVKKMRCFCLFDKISEYAMSCMDLFVNIFLFVGIIIIINMCFVCAKKQLKTENEIEFYVNEWKQR